MRILGFQKTTLLDYPHKLAATIFLGGCNFRCPFCHNASIIVDQKQTTIPKQSILEYLEKRKGVLEGICITGGEPTIDSALPELIYSIKQLGYCVKLDTNGSNPELLADLLNNHTIDYVAMDVKNSKEKYSITAGRNVDVSKIEQSVSLLLDNRIPYEFRTTVVKEFHQIDDFKQIGQWIQGASQYYLQNFVDSDRLICPHQFHSYTKEELNQFVSVLEPYVSKISLRGID